MGVVFSFFTVKLRYIDSGRYWYYLLTSHHKRFEGGYPNMQLKNPMVWAGSQNFYTACLTDLARSDMELERDLRARRRVEKSRQVSPDHKSFF